MYTERYKDLFIQRPDAFAFQDADGTYHRVNGQVTDEVIVKHLLGIHTCGWYSTYQNRVRWGCIDCDREDGVYILSGVRERLNVLGVPSYLEQSREGRGHLWVFSEEVEAGTMRSFLRSQLPFEMEVFPKQDNVSEKGYGSLVRGVFGVHRKDNGRYGFLDENLNKVAYNLDGQLAYLDSIRVIPAELIPRSETPKVETRKPQEIRWSFDLVGLASQFTTLQLRANYYVGLCPLHKEGHSSFAVYPNNGYDARWICFHEFQGGDAVELVARIYGVTRKEAFKLVSQKLAG